VSSNDSGLRDEVAADLNGSTEPDYGPQPDPIPDRPADGAKAEKWAAYVVALGLHPDEAGNYSRSELIDLADRLGG
jgi:hypothetical protein